jgi:hypothetical protein
MLEGFDDESDTPSERFQFFDHPRGVLPDSTRQITHTAALLVVEPVLLVSDLPLWFRLLVVIDPI